MSELTTEARGGVLRTLPELEAAIGYYKRQTAEGIIGIGAALNEAKEQLGHGEWLPWLEKVQINARAAQNYMRVAREIAPGSVMAGLPYSKALALLDAPAETREQLLDEGVDDKSAAEIKRLIRERDQALSTNQLQVDKLKRQQAELDAANRAREKAEQEKAQAVDRAREQEMVAKRHLEARKDAIQRYNVLSDEMDELLKRPKETVEVEVPPEDYEDLKASVESLRAQLADAEAAVEEAEARAMGAPQAEADEYEDDTVTPGGFVEACNEFMAKVQFYPYHKEDLAAIGDSGRRSMEIFTQGVQNWTVRMLSALAAAGGQVDCGGAVTADV